MGGRVIAKNRKAYFQYEIGDEYTAGLVLTGTEIKSIRAGHVSITEAYALFFHGELWLRNMHVAEYDWGSYGNHEPGRDRKLLLTRKELNKLRRGVEVKGVTIVALRLFINERGYAKVALGLARGKRLYDKRATIKDRDSARELARIRKERY